MTRTIDYATLLTLAETAHKSGLFKKFDSKEKIFTVMARGHEIGLEPFVSLEVFNSIHNGPPTLGKRGIAILLGRAGYQLAWTEATDESVTIVASYPGKAPYTARYTIQEARRAGYTKNAKYSTEPQEMLAARALSRIATNYAAEILGGLPLALEDDQPAAAPPVAVAAPLAPVQVPAEALAEAMPEASPAQRAEAYLSSRGMLDAAVENYGRPDTWDADTLAQIRAWAAAYAD